MVRSFHPKKEEPPKTLVSQKIARKSAPVEVDILRRRLRIPSKHFNSPDTKFVVIEGRPLVIQYDIVISGRLLHIPPYMFPGYELIGCTERLENMNCSVSTHFVDGPIGIYHIPHIQRRELRQRPRLSGLRLITGRLTEDMREELLKRYDLFSITDYEELAIPGDIELCNCSEPNQNLHHKPQVTYSFRNHHFQNFQHQVLYRMNHPQPTENIGLKHFQELFLEKKIQGIDEDTLKVVNYIYFASFMHFPNVFLMMNHWYSYTPVLVTDEANNPLLSSITSVEARIGLVKVVMISRIMGNKFWSKLYNFACSHLHMCSLDFVCHLVREFSIEWIRENSPNITVFLIDNCRNGFDFIPFMQTEIGKAFVKSMINARYYTLVSANRFSLLTAFESKSKNPLAKSAPVFEQYKDGQPPSDVESESESEMEEEENEKVERRNRMSEE